MNKIIITALLIFAGSANAGLIKSGSIISDTSTGLDWMELSATTDITYNQMLSNFNDPNSLFYGFEYATFTQIQVLFNSEGYSGDFYDYVADFGSRNAVSQIYDLFGRTGTSCCDRGDGMFLNENGGFVDWFYYIPEIGASESLVRVLDNLIDPNVVFWDGSSSSNNNEMGSWIVRKTSKSVPEPALLAMLGLGLAGIGFLRKNKKS
jgi:hypothetical protein